MPLKTISPEAAQALLAQGAVLVDIRPADEHARMRIPQAQHVPLPSLHAPATRFERDLPVIFHCRSGARTQMNAEALAQCAGCDAYALEGGLDAWVRAGLMFAGATGLCGLARLLVKAPWNRRALAP